MHILNVYYLVSDMLQSVIAQAVYLGIKWHLTLLARHQSGSVIGSVVSDLMMSSVPYQSGSRSELFQVRCFMASAHLLLLKEVRRKKFETFGTIYDSVD
jgi:hypothetical protein